MLLYNAEERRDIILALERTFQVKFLIICCCYALHGSQYDTVYSMLCNSDTSSKETPMWPMSDTFPILEHSNT